MTCLARRPAGQDVEGINCLLERRASTGRRASGSRSCSCVSPF